MATRTIPKPESTSGGITDLSTGATGTLPVSNGGTGVTTLTSNAIYKGAGTSPIAVSGITDDGTTVTVAEILTMSGKAFNSAKGADIASASSIDLGAATGNYVEITGTTGITALGTVQAGTIRFVRFIGALTLTYNATSLILPGARDIVTAANDRAIFVSLGSGNWICVSYLKASASALGDVVTTSHAATEAATAATMYGNFHNVTGAYTVTLPSAVVGMSATFNATTAATYSLDCQSADHFVLAGTALTAGNKITSSGFAGDQVEVICTAANTWTVKHISGVFIDGGS